jgi:hypothetical protein
MMQRTAHCAAGTETRSQEQKSVCTEYIDATKTHEGITGAQAKDATSFQVLLERLIHDIYQ